MCRSRHRLSILRRLEIVGCIKEVHARAFLDGKLKNRRYRCVKMIREPTEADWQAFVDSAYRGLDDGEAGRQSQQVLQDNYQDDDIVDADSAPGVHGAEEIQEVSRPIPRWTPDQHISNFIFNLVNDAGEQGISTMVSCGSNWLNFCTTDNHGGLAKLRLWRYLEETA